MASILVVDDEAGIRDLLTEVLQDAGHRVYAAESADAARRLVATYRFDLALLDVWMPGEDGLQLIESWHSTGSLPCSIVMLSGYGTLDRAVTATRLGAVAFLEKPIRLQSLLSEVAGALRGAPVPVVVDAPEPSTAAAGRSTTTPVLDFTLPYREARTAFEREYLAFQLRRCGGRVALLADAIGLERTNLYRKLKELNLLSA
ncbi:MAG: response regulator [Anaerolineae bacterium]|nr:response regulator [Anaerolineae bacterium]